MNRRLHRTSLRSEPAVSRLDAHVGYWLRYVSNQYSQALNRKLGDKGLTLADWIALRELYEGDLTPSALAERLGMTRGAVSKLARKLVSSLMIEQTSSGEGRTQVLSLTEHGRTVLRVLAVLLDTADQEFFGHLDPDTRALIVATMRDIVRRRGLRDTPAD